MKRGIDSFSGMAYGAWLVLLLLAAGQAGAGQLLTLTVAKELPGLGGERMAVRGNMVYLQRDTSLVIYDLGAPDHPVLVGSLDLPTTSEGMQANVTVSENLLALSAWPVGGGRERIYVIDITNPSTPQLASSWERMSSALQLVGSYLYVTSPTPMDTSFQVYDLSNPASPQAGFSASRTLPLAEGGMSENKGAAEGIGVSGHYAFMRFGYGRTEALGVTTLPLLVVWDITNPASPAEAAAIPIPTANSYYYPACVLGGETLFFAGFFFPESPDSKGGSTIDVGDPVHPQFLADMAWTLSGTGLDGSMIYAAPAGADGCMVLPFETGLAFVDLTNPATPKARGVFLHGTKDAGFLGNYIALLDADALRLLRKPGTGTTFDAYGVSPASTGIGAAITLTVLGNALVSGTTAVLVRGDETITALSAAPNADGTELAAVFDLSQAEPGAWTLRVTAPGNPAGDLAVTITPGPAITITSVTPDTAPAWNTATLTVQGTNFGSDMTAQLIRGRQDPLTADTVQADAGGASATLTFPVTGAFPAGYALRLSRPGYSPGEAFEALSLTSTLQFASFTPKLAIAGQSVSVTITGAGFLASDTVRLVNGSQPAMPAQNRTVTEDGASMTMTFTAGPLAAPDWTLEIVRASGELFRQRDVLDILSASMLSVEVTPQQVSGLQQQATLHLAGVMPLTGVQPVLLAGDRVIQPTQVTPVNPLELDAVFPLDANVPLGPARLSLELEGAPFATKPFLLVGDIERVTRQSDNAFWVQGAGFVTGCSAWLEETNTGRRIDASGLSEVAFQSIRVTMPGAVPSGAYQLNMQGPNGRVITMLTSGVKPSPRLVVVGAGLSHLSSPTGGKGGQVTLTVHGQGLDQPQGFQLVRSGAVLEGTGFAANLDNPDNQLMSALFDLSEAEMGEYDVQITTATGGPYLIKSAFSVAEPAPDVTVSLNMPNKARVGREARGAVLVQNTGNVDTSGSVVLVDVPFDAVISFPKVPAGTPEAVTKQTMPDGSIGIQLGEIEVAAGQQVEVSVTLLMDKEKTLNITPTWIGVHQK